ncbi:MAG: VOC family protein [Eubacteriales bacterium]|nr:VOC family protein [Eubacteriales bacterium]
MAALFQNVDCIELYVSDLDEGLAYYEQALGLKLLWRADTSLGLGMSGGVAEIVLQTDRKKLNVDFKVDSVEEALPRIIRAGGRVTCPAFDIPIGRCAVVQDRWGNEYVLLDMTKGKYTTDENGNVTGVGAPSL